METLKELTIKGGIREGFKDGTSKACRSPVLRLHQIRGGILTINEAEAKTVCWIFEQYPADFYHDSFQFHYWS